MDAGDGAFRGVLAEELRVGHRLRVKATMVDARPVEELPIRRVQPVVIFAHLDVKIRDPAKLAIDISIFGHFGVLGHARPFELILIVWVHCALWVDHHSLCVLEFLVEILLQGRRSRL